AEPVAVGGKEQRDGERGDAHEIDGQGHWFHNPVFGRAARQLEGGKKAAGRPPARAPRRSGARSRPSERGPPRKCRAGAAPDFPRPTLSEAPRGDTVPGTRMSPRPKTRAVHAQGLSPHEPRAR